MIFTFSSSDSLSSTAASPASAFNSPLPTKAECFGGLEMREGALLKHAQNTAASLPCCLELRLWQAGCPEKVQQEARHILHDDTRHSE